MPFYKEEMQMELSSCGKREEDYEYSPEDYVYVKTFDESEIERENRYATDTFRAGRISFEIVTPTTGIRDPRTATRDMIMEDTVPGLLARLAVDNTDNDRDIDAVFAISVHDFVKGPIGAAKCG